MKLHYLLVVVGDVEPELQGPFPTTDDRDHAAGEHRSANPEDDGLYMVDLQVPDGPVGSAPDANRIRATDIHLEVDSYSGGYMDELVAEAEAEAARLADASLPAGKPHEFFD